MAKTIKITFYNPKELWFMFWNWAFWPRRKKCAEWCNYYHQNLLCSISDIFYEYEKSNSIKTDVALDLADKIGLASEKIANEITELMSKPMNDN